MNCSLETEETRCLTAVQAVEGAACADAGGGKYSFVVGGEANTAASRCSLSLRAPHPVNHSHTQEPHKGRLFQYRSALSLSQSSAAESSIPSLQVQSFLK